MADAGIQITKQSRTSLVTFLIVFTLVGVVAARMIAPYLIAIAMGGILAMLASPLQRRLVKRGLKESWAAALLTTCVVLLVVAPVLALTITAIKQAVTIGHWVTTTQPLSFQDVLNRVSAWGPLHYVVGDAAELQTQLDDVVRTLSANASGFVLNLAKSVPDVMLNLLLSCMACYFFRIDGRSFLSWTLTKIPLEADIRQKLAGSFKDTAISVVWASMAAAGTQSLIMMLAFGVLGVPAAMLAAGATFIFAWIPIVGSTPVWLAGAGYLYAQGRPGMMAAMVVFGVVTGLVDNLVRPMVLKGRGEMHPLVALVAIFGGIRMFGLFGVFFGPILAAVVITMLQVWPLVGRRSGLDVAGGVLRPNESL